VVPGDDFQRQYRHRHLGPTACTMPAVVDHPGLVERGQIAWMPSKTDRPTMGRTTGLLSTTYNLNAGTNFLDGYYDDEGCGLSLDQAYDLTGPQCPLFEHGQKPIISDMTEVGTAIATEGFGGTEPGPIKTPSPNRTVSAGRHPTSSKNTRGRGNRSYFTGPPTNGLVFRAA